MEPPSLLASLPASGPCRNTTCPLNEWMRAPHNDGDGDEEEEVKRAEIQVSVPDSASVCMNSFNLMTRLCVGVGG